MSDSDRQRYEFQVAGKVQPKQRPRRSSNGRWYTPSDTADYEERVAWYARGAGVRVIEGPVRLSIDIYWPDRRRRDLDNGGKSIADALNGIAYEDDYQIVEKRLTKRLDRDNPRAEIVVEALEDPEPTQESLL